VTNTTSKTIKNTSTKLLKETDSARNLFHDKYKLPNPLKFKNSKNKNFYSMVH